MLKKLQENLLYIFIFLLPLQTCYITRELFLNGAKWEYGTICFYLSDLILILLFGVFIFLICHPERSASWRRVEGSRRFNLRDFSTSLRFGRNGNKNLITKILILLTLWTFSSIIWSPDKQLALYSAIKLVSAIALFFVIINTKINWKKLLLIFILAATLQGGLGLWQFFTQDAPANKYLGISAHHSTTLGVSVVQTEGRRWLRSYGGQTHPNILGGYLAIALFFAISLYLRINQKENQSKKDLYTRLFLLVSLILLFSGLLTTFSRSAWLVFGLGFILIVILGKRSIPPTVILSEAERSRSLPDREAGISSVNHTRFLHPLSLGRNDRGAIAKILFLFLIITTFFIFNFKEVFLPRLTINNHLEIQSIEERIDYTAQAKSLIQNNLLKGVGIGNYTIANYNKLKKDMPAWYFQPVHNGYLLILAELGIIGFVLFLSFLMISLRKSVHWLKRGNPIFFTSIISLLIIMLFDHWLWSSHFGLLLLFLILGLFVKTTKPTID